MRRPAIPETIRNLTVLAICGLLAAGCSRKHDDAVTTTTTMTVTPPAAAAGGSNTGPLGPGDGATASAPAGGAVAGVAGETSERAAVSPPANANGTLPGAPGAVESEAPH